jgi:hypothetical protein
MCKIWLVKLRCHLLQLKCIEAPCIEFKPCPSFCYLFVVLQQPSVIFIPVLWIPDLMDTLCCVGSTPVFLNWCAVAFWIQTQFHTFSSGSSSDILFTLGLSSHWPLLLLLSFYICYILHFIRSAIFDINILSLLLVITCSKHCTQPIGIF